MLIDLKAFRDTFFYPIQFSAPHIYLSALPFASPTSMVSKLFLPKFPSLPVVQRSTGHTHTASECPILQLEGHKNGITCAAFSPDGKSIVSGSEDYTLRVWNIENIESGSLLLEGHEAEVCSVAFSPNGNYVASRSMDDTIQLWDIKTGKSILKQLAQGTIQHCATSVSFTPDGKYVVSASRDVIQLLNIETGEMELKPFQFDEPCVEFLKVAFSADGKYIALGLDTGRIRLQNIETGKVEATFNALRYFLNRFRALSFSPDGKYIVCGSNHSMQLWNIETGQEIWERIINGFVAFSPDGQYIVSGSDDIVRLWDVKTGAAVSRPFPHPHCVTSVLFSPNGKYIVSGSVDCTIRLWKIDSTRPDNETRLRPSEGHADLITSISFSPDGNYIASGSKDCTIRLWNVETGEAALDPFVGPSHTDSVTCISFSPDGKYIASSSKDDTIRLWNVRTQSGEKPKQFKLVGHTKPNSDESDSSGGIESISFSPDGNYIASGSGCGSGWDTIRLWNVKTGEPALRPFWKSRDLVEFVSFSPDGDHIASIGGFESFDLLNMKTGQVSLNEREKSKNITCVSFSPDGKYIAGCHDNWMAVMLDDNLSAIRGVQVWKVGTGEVAFKLDLSNIESQTPIKFVAFSPDGKYILISNRHDWMIQPWAADSERNAVQAPMPFRPRRHQSIIDSVSFSPDGRYIAYGTGTHRTIRIYNNDIAEQIHHDNLRAVRPMFLHQYPTGSVLIDGDGWLRYPSGELMLWVPPELHLNLYSSGAVSIIGSTDVIRIDLSRFMQGTEWLGVSGNNLI
jgi:WD40 repeat protein